MLQISKLISLGTGLAPVLLKRASTVELDWDVRQKSRFDALDSLGRQLGVSLPHSTLLRGGDVLIAEDGSMVRVVAAPQPVLRITACTAHGSPFDLTRAAYHLGRRQVPTELQADHLKIEPDPVLADMLWVALLRMDGKPAAFSFDINAGTHKFAIANSYDVAFRQRSPGKLLYYRNLVRAVADGITRVDWGAGDSGYKRLIGAEPGPAIRDWLFLRPGLPALAGRLLAKRWARQGQSPTREAADGD